MPEQTILRDPARNEPDPKLFEPGSHGCHEAFHVAAMLAELVDERLCLHPAVLAVPKWGEIAGRACDALHELYQAIGLKHCK